MSNSRSEQAWNQNSDRIALMDKLRFSCLVTNLLAIDCIQCTGRTENSKLVSGTMNCVLTPESVSSKACPSGFDLCYVRSETAEKITGSGEDKNITSMSEVIRGCATSEVSSYFCEPNGYWRNIEVTECKKTCKDDGCNTFTPSSAASFLLTLVSLVLILV